METKSVADPPPAKKRCTDETMEIEHTQLPASPPPAKKDDKVFNDPIHGHIRLHPLLVKIIDTPQFQRLRYIKQLGGCYFVYPGASHNRFEHSIGVAHLAGKLIENIEREQPELDISPCEVLCVKIAGLCHDLGHGPFSHLWDKRFHKKKWEQEEEYIKMKKEWEQEKESLKKRWEQKEASLKKDREQEEESFKKEWEEEKESLKKKWEQKEKSLKKELKWEHETGSEKMLDYLIKENGLLGEYMDKNNCLTEDHIQLIKRLINPEIDYEKDWPYPGLKNKSFLFEIVANKRNGVDVDKWDYFKRDCHHLGIACSFDIDRAMQFIRVVEVEGLRQICFRDKEVPNMYQLFQTRLCLHRAAYQHKTSNAVECMLTEALILADRHITIDGHDDNGQPSTSLMSECKDKMGFFINLTDEVVQRILASSAKDGDLHDDLKLSQKLLKRIQKRDLYKLVGQIPHSYEIDLAKSFANEIPPNGELTKDDLELDIVSFDFGKKSRNPVDYIHFYRKSEPNKVIEASSRDFSKMLPKDDFQEVIIRVYCKSADKFTEAERYFIKWCEEKGVNYKASHPFGAGPHFPTPVPSSRAKLRDNTGKPKRLEFEDKKEDVQNN